MNQSHTAVSLPNYCYLHHSLQAKQIQYNSQVQMNDQTFLNKCYKNVNKFRFIVIINTFETLILSMFIVSKIF